MSSYGFGDRQVARVVLDLDYLDHLVLRAFHVELNLGVLVGGSDGPVWRRALAVLAQ